MGRSRILIFLIFLVFFFFLKVPEEKVLIDEEELHGIETDGIFKLRESI